MAEKPSELAFTRLWNPCDFGQTAPERPASYAAASFFSWAARRDTFRDPVFL